ncbi:methyltransferase domain-containing protein [Amycolatopsis mongoliensis]|uniref:Methyltransferase domain-containing protein n=1 Tax=Amycolatopsis mongoliensis TaxID=715475 RepID=A0A9Y2NJQ5_9PSEU|nr:class I SAM-dependent methyltransferase [Amycolatopsis sp. 4-36]WIY00345.1 methyltransferase domain-containing protein [Amycolatopsis sp. 4-36]
MATAAEARAKYDRIADRYEEIFFYVGDVGARLAAFAGPPPGARALDVGAGRGAVARALLARGCAVTAIDASPEMVARLAADHPELTARTMDAAAPDFPDATFDLVTAGFVVQVLDDPAAVLAQVRRMLVPGGTIALSLERQSVGRLSWLQELSVEFFSPGSPAEPAPEPSPGTGPMDAEGLDSLLTEAGFTGLAREEIEMPLPLDGPEALWEWLQPRGGTELVAALGERAGEFHARFLDGARTMGEDGGITLDFAATLHRAHRPG